MAKYCGNIGFSIPTETTPGVWEEVITEGKYYGDTNQDHMRPRSTDTVNDNIVCQDEISIIANPFAMNNFHSIKYAVYMGTKWKVTSVDVRYPRLVLTLGEVYNG